MDSGFELGAVLRRVVQQGDCWIWLGAKSHNGYGRISRGVCGKTVSAMVHRVVYELIVGPIPPNLHLDHLCRRRDCCNPSHLDPVTAQENNRRGMGATGRNYRAEQCMNGHPFDQQNTYLRPDGRGRQCRSCQRDNERRSQQRKPRRSALIKKGLGG